MSSSRNPRRSSSPAPKKGFLSKIKGFFGASEPEPEPQSSRSRGGSGGGNRNRSRGGSGGGNRQGRSGGGRSGGGRSEGGRRGPEIREVTGTRLYVGNISYDSTEEDLEELFRGVGSVESAEVVIHSRTQRSKGFAFVEMSSVDQAKRAAEQLHDQEFMGRRIVVTGARPKEYTSE